MREVDGWKDVLPTQLGRIENPDRKGRFQFVMPALSADPAERERWFVALKDVANRRREPWVLDGLNLPASPAARRGVEDSTCSPASTCCGTSRRPATSSSPSGGSTPRSAATTPGTWPTRCATFLKNLPAHYPDRLRNITLQSADELFRAADIVKQ